MNILLILAIIYISIIVIIVGIFLFGIWKQYGQNPLITILQIPIYMWFHALLIPPYLLYFTVFDNKK